MRTPYDAALRALDRDMDALKGLIADATARLEEMQSLHEALGTQILRERALSAMDWQLYAEAYLDRARAERRQLEQLRHDAEIELTMLRRQAAQQYASMKAIGNAADAYRAEAERVAQTAEQAMLDDLTAARFVRRARDLRRSSR
ncbi:hypothetical protein [Sphingomonas sp.]|uniref:hypothetical protein n=1 Tax=Sphingomonas sp. TaxID=28214 RepID=UPI000BCA4FC1|nr:hypothetical protein [Sphingomonas sp.]MBA4761515.1 hypothetical protein [Sphingomonas sp.]OYX51504.1 MAG: hypothetical protein B7Y97_05035 [Sphingomonas sp. 32-66-10]